jgi:hypothetical protein
MISNSVLQTNYYVSNLIPQDLQPATLFPISSPPEPESVDRYPHTAPSVATTKVHQ